jgi:hypothetical protein
MDIQSTSVDIEQARVQEQAAVQAEEMRLDAMKQEAAVRERQLSSDQQITDPNLGQSVDLLD